MTPAGQAAALVDHTRHLGATLTALAEALASGDAAAVLAVEPALAAALVPLSAASPALADDERAALDFHLAEARSALARCRAVGAAAALVARATLDALGHADTYHRHGTPTLQGAHRHEFDTRA
ncbi:MAG: hypothetical protein AB7O28_08340 [Vicinamibacterales bacterium]